MLKTIAVLLCVPTLSIACLGAAPEEVVGLHNIQLSKETFAWDDTFFAKDVGFEFTNISTCLLNSFSVRVRVFDGDGTLIDERTAIALRPGTFQDGFPNDYSLLAAIGVRAPDIATLDTIETIALFPIEVTYFTN